MKTLKWLGVAMLVLGVCTSQVQAQCSPGISIEMSAEYQGTDTQVGYAYDGSTGCLATTVDFKVLISLTATACAIENGVVDLVLPNGTVVNLDTDLALSAGGSQAYDVTGSPYTVAFADLGTQGAPGDNVRGSASIAATALRPGLPNQQVSGDANFDIRVLHPRVKVTKSVDRDQICVDDPNGVEYTYRVEWGDTPAGEEATDSDLEQVSVLDDTCDSPVRGLDDPGNDDNVLEDGEVWVYTCSTLLTETTTNTVTVTFVEPILECQVEATDEVTVTVTAPPVCGITGPDSVCEGASDVEYCSDVSNADSYLWEITGDGEISGSATGDCVLVNPTGPGGFTLSLHICYGDCCSDCRLAVDVIPAPDCSISGPTSLCQEDVNTPVQYCSGAVADHYLWSIVSGPATIDGAADANCVTIIPSALGTIVLGLEISNDVLGDGTCGNSCRIEILVEECGQTFCSFTQGFWGNAGGKACDGQTTTELIEGCLPVVVGLPGNQITFDTAQCILDSLPAGGKPAAIPDGNWTCADLSSFYKNKKQTELNNVLIGQVVALTLNLCVSPDCLADDASGDLGGWILPAEFCTVPAEDPNACPKQYTIPADLVGKTVQELLDAANAALAGDDTYSLSDIYTAVTAINEGFDECATVVDCGLEIEICENGCDDDYDGRVDEGDCVFIVEE